MAETQSVVAGDSTGLGGKAKLVQDGKHEISRAIAGEVAAGAIGSVGSGCKAEDEDTGAWVAETGNGACPVLVIAVGGATHLTNTSTVTAQARAERAGGDSLAEAVMVGSKGGEGDQFPGQRTLERLEW